MLQLLRDLRKTLSKYEMIYFTTFFRFIIKYRQTTLGPFWVLMQPLAFILFLGALFTGLSSESAERFIPHLAIGYVAWTLLGGYISRGPGIFIRNKSFLMFGKRTLTDTVILDNLELIVHFLHQLLIVAGVCVIFKTTNFQNVCFSLLGLIAIMINGYFYSMALSIFASRFKDLQEAVSPFNSIFFLATPIIWMPGPSEGTGKTQILESYMKFNPFYHFLELFRAPLLSNPVDSASIIFVFVATLLGFLLACLLYWKTKPVISHWIN